MRARKSTARQLCEKKKKTHTKIGFWLWGPWQTKWSETFSSRFTHAFTLFVAFNFQRHPAVSVKINLMTFRGPFSDLFRSDHLTFLSTVEQRQHKYFINQILLTLSRNILSFGIGIMGVFAASCIKLVSNSNALLGLPQVLKGTKKQSGFRGRTQKVVDVWVRKRSPCVTQQANTLSVRFSCRWRRGG